MPQNKWIDEITAADRAAARAACKTGLHNLAGIIEYDILHLENAFAHHRRQSIADYVAGQWRPIDSAPKDGTDILVWADHGQYVVSWDDGGWTVDDNKSDYIPLRGSEPTHWMPRPAAPMGDAA